MEENNPYAAPSANLQSGDSYGKNERPVGAAVVVELAGTKGWTRFLGVLMVIFSLLGMITLSSASGSVRRSLAAFGMGALGAEAALLVMFLFLAVLFTYGVLMNRFSSAVTRLVRSGTERELIESIRRQKAIWVFWGLVSIVTALWEIYMLIKRLTRPDPYFD